MENHFTELGEAIFSAFSLLGHFRESFHRINRESLHFEKTIWQSRSDSLRESAPWGAPKRTHNQAYLLLTCTINQDLSEKLHTHASKYYVHICQFSTFVMWEGSVCGATYRRTSPETTRSPHTHKKRELGLTWDARGPRAGSMDRQRLTQAGGQPRPGHAKQHLSHLLAR
jgi:hypothetical protein